MCPAGPQALVAQGDPRDLSAQMEYKVRRDRWDHVALQVYQDRLEDRQGKQVLKVLEVQTV